MTISELIAALEGILDREGDCDVRIDPDRRDAVEKAEYVEGYEESGDGGGWDICHVQLS
jgi:hypothetical protein